MPLQSPIAPSVIITRKHSPPISITAREGSANPPPAALEWADALPSRDVIHSAASQSATPTTRLSSRGSTPAAAAMATTPAETKPPTLQPPWSEDMIGFVSSRSTATPCAFMETSIAPLLAPNTNRIAPSVYGPVARSGSGSIRQKISVVARVTEALVRRSRT